MSTEDLRLHLINFLYREGKRERERESQRGVEGGVRMRGEGGLIVPFLWPLKA